MSEKKNEGIDEQLEKAVNELSLFDNNISQDKEVYKKYVKHLKGVEADNVLALKKAVIEILKRYVQQGYNSIIEAEKGIDIILQHNLDKGKLKGISIGTGELKYGECKIQSQMFHLLNGVKCSNEDGSISYYQSKIEDGVAKGVPIDDLTEKDKMRVRNIAFGTANSWDIEDNCCWSSCLNFCCNQKSNDNLGAEYIHVNALQYV